MPPSIDVDENASLGPSYDPNAKFGVEKDGYVDRSTEASMCLCVRSA